jgi:hypothetical protein
MNDNPFFDDPLMNDGSWSNSAPDYNTTPYQPDFQPPLETELYPPFSEPDPVWNIDPTTEVSPAAWTEQHSYQPDPSAPMPSTDFVAPDTLVFEPPAFDMPADSTVVSDTPADPSTPDTATPDDSMHVAPNTFDDTPLIDNDAQWHMPATSWNATDFDGLGDPVHESPYWNQQQGQNSCAVVAQMSILESITGEQVSEDAICKMAEENHWFDPQTGTAPENVGKILNAFGVPTEQKTDASLVDIAAALERGDKVIVGLDALEIWQPIRDGGGQPVEQTLPSGQNAGHAVWVTGIDQQPDGSVKLILNDSGTPDGQMKAVDAYDFVNAWSDYGNFLVVAHPPAQPATH